MGFYRPSARGSPYAQRGTGPRTGTSAHERRRGRGPDGLAAAYEAPPPRRSPLCLSDWAGHMIGPHWFGHSPLPPTCLATQQERLYDQNGIWQLRGLPFVRLPRARTSTSFAVSTSKSRCRPDRKRPARRLLQTWGPARAYANFPMFSAQPRPAGQLHTSTALCSWNAPSGRTCRGLGRKRRSWRRRLDLLTVRSGRNDLLRTRAGTRSRWHSFGGCLPGG